MCPALQPPFPGTQLSCLCVGGLGLGHLALLHRRAVGGNRRATDTPELGLAQSGYRVAMAGHSDWACCVTGHVPHRIPGLPGGCSKGGGSNRGLACTCAVVRLSLVCGPVTRPAGVGGGGCLVLLYLPLIVLPPENTGWPLGKKARGKAGRGMRNRPGGAFYLFIYHYYYFWLYCTTCGILSSPTRDQARAPLNGGESLDHWTAKEGPEGAFSLDFFGCPGSSRLCTSFSLVVASGGYSGRGVRVSPYGGSLAVELRLQGTQASAVAVQGLGHCGSQVREHRLSSRGAWA